MSKAIELHFLTDTPCEDWQSDEKETCPIRENFDDKDGYELCWLCGWTVYYNQLQEETPEDVEPT